MVFSTCTNFPSPGQQGCAAQLCCSAVQDTLLDTGVPLSSLRDIPPPVLLQPLCVHTTSSEMLQLFPWLAASTKDCSLYLLATGKQEMFFPQRCRAVPPLLFPGRILVLPHLPGADRQHIPRDAEGTAWRWLGWVHPSTHQSLQTTTSSLLVGVFLNCLNLRF